MLRLIKCSSSRATVSNSGVAPLLSQSSTLTCQKTNKYCSSLRSGNFQKESATPLVFSFKACWFSQMCYSCCLFAHAPWVNASWCDAPSKTVKLCTHFLVPPSFGCAVVQHCCLICLVFFFPFCKRVCVRVWERESEGLRAWKQDVVVDVSVPHWCDVYLQLP